MNHNPIKPTVCRRLFADDNDPTVEQSNLETARFDNSHNTILEKLLRTREEVRDKWNFDFETETPLEGDWEWERVEQPVQPIGRVQVQPQPVEKTRDDGNNKSL